MTQAPRHRIDIEVQTSYIEAQSAPDANRYVFSYTITIRNNGDQGARLLDRKLQEVRGEGVVGEQPHLRPGEHFRYPSGTMIETPVGTMQGSYGMLSDSGDRFDAEIKAFTLSQPRTLH